MEHDLWTYREEAWQGPGTRDEESARERGDLEGFTVAARDGEVGKVAEATFDERGSYLVVDTGLPIVGKTTVVPAGFVRDVDSLEQTVYVDRTKDEIEEAPEVDVERLGDEEYRRELSAYYTTR